MFKKNKKQTETIKEPKEKKVRTVKVGTHKKTVIALWVVLVASVSFGVYKNFTAIDQHTTCLLYTSFLAKISDWSDEMNDIVKDMQEKVGCEYISDLPSYKRRCV